jgi:hypothetical protein
LLRVIAQILVTWILKMNFAEHRLEVLARTVANLNAQLSELNELREQIRSGDARHNKAASKAAWKPSESVSFASTLRD